MDENFKIEIISPEKIVFSEDTKMVTLPSYEGEMSVLKNHIPIITFLRPGIIKTEKKEGDLNKFFVEDGTVEFFKDVLVVLSASVINVKNLSKESIINQNTRIIQKFVSKKISELIEVFLKAVKLKEDQWDIEETRDKINFIGNMRKPYTLAPMLANRARPVEGGAGTAGFFFWQPRTKMNFKSIES